MKKPTTQGNLLDDSLPALQELQQHPQWVLWRYEERDCKATEVPYSAITRKRAAVDNPATWASYVKARAVLARFSDQYDGLGFVFDSDTIPLTGSDSPHFIGLRSGIEPPEMGKPTERVPSPAPSRNVRRSMIPTGNARITKTACPISSQAESSCAT